MEELLPRLRIMSQAAGDSGTPEQRETTLRRFIEDLGLSVHPRLLKAQPEHVVRVLYIQWCKHITAGVDRENLLDWMAVAIVNPLGTPMRNAPEQQPTNVVSLFG